MISRRKFGAVAASVVAGAAAAFGLQKQEPEYTYKYQLNEGAARPSTDKHGRVYCHICRTHVMVTRRHVLFTYDDDLNEQTEFANLHCRLCDEKLIEMEIVLASAWTESDWRENRTSHRDIIRHAYEVAQGG